MIKKSKNLILILLILAIFTGIAIELSEGSIAAGGLLFLVSVFLLTRIDIKDLSDSSLLKTSKTRVVVGIFILLADVLYNFEKGGKLGTLDLMVISLGISLVGTQMHNIEAARYFRFGMYISSVFIVLYMIFYTLFTLLNIDFLHKFNHLFILLPTVRILDLAGIPFEVVTLETVRLRNGIEEMTLDIGGPFSGLYSMFLLIGIVFGYGRIKNMEINKTLKMLGSCIVITYISNLLRIMIIYWIAYMYGKEAMMTVSDIGWIISVVAILIFFRFVQNQCVN